MHSKFRYKIYASGFNLDFEKIRTIIQKNGAGEILKREEKLVQKGQLGGKN